ncbi:CLUMA_CG017230, isoform A [Clunio marinus]|uniref:CLUMA_CG017230, isoform A n=1 Tax=Clunio marinus TaxID=568069 RepID=A0A1J1IY99_9DIPT|nr:CLUMA_CG017230, isoform A [Clunio marinus]
MTIILFLIDTSASMNQEAFVNGVHKTYLDIAKGAVETFLKYRQRSQDCMGDRYMLLTFEDTPCNVKAGWKENHATFMNELKNLQACGLTTVGEALKSAFDLLNLNRMQSGIDTYGQGRCPFYLEPSIIILVTDGGRYSHRNGIENQLSLPLNINIPGVKLTKEPFRWDQRLFSLILRMPGHKVDERGEGKVPHDDSPLEKMCEVTGGRSYRVKSQYVLNQCIESLVQKAQPGVVINFEPVFKDQKDLKDGEVPEMIFQSAKKMIYVHKIPALKQFPVGYWPIPESYWPDSKMSSLPPRDAHPRIRICLTPHDEPQIVRNFPIDKYELEPSPLTLWMLSKMKDPNKVYPLLVLNANGVHDPMSQYRMHQPINDQPFGYLKANSTLMVVHLYVLPYNYQFVLALIYDLVHKLTFNPTSEWINKFTTYVKSIPQYYYQFLRKALTMISIPYQLLQYILPESLDSYLNATVANQLKQMKNVAKQEQEQLCVRVFKQLKLPKMPYHQHETVKLNCGQAIKIPDLVKHPMLRDTFQKMHSEINTFENYSIVVPTVMNIQSTKNYRNPFDIPRRDLIDEISRMRDNFFKLPTRNINLMSKDAGHSLPIAEMGNYQDYLKRREPPLRELEPTNVRQHMFGNPYKRDKHMVMVDEADDITSDPSSPNNKIPNANKKDIRMSRKRKAGPIRKDFVYKRARTEFGFPMSPGLPCPPSPMGSEIDDSDTASEFSVNDDDSRRSNDSDYNEVTDDEFRLNGHMAAEYNFDNVLNESRMEIIPSSLQQNYPPRSMQSVGLSRLNLQQLEQQQQSMSSNFQQNYPIHHFHQPPIGSVPIVPHLMPNNGDITGSSIQSPAIGSAMAQPVPSSPTGPPPPFPSISTPPVIPTPSATPITIRSQPHNDLNDAQNISKILQSSIHNGSGSTITSTNHNNNHSSSEKRLFVDEQPQQHLQQPKGAASKSNNHKDENVKAGDDQQHHRSRRKQKTTSNVTSTAVVKSNQHTHTNGLNSNSNSSSTTDKILNNNSVSSFINGDDGCCYDDEDIVKWKQENSETRAQAFKEIRRFGRNYNGLYEQLDKIKGTFEMRFNFIQMCISEALRFRRKHMVKCIEEWWTMKCDDKNIKSTGKVKT